MPMTDAGDKLRHAVAVQSFREALKVYTPETHLEAWTSTMLNMANALQYLPSARPEEHLIQAVETYEQLLEVRNKAMDPLGYARLLANQANALAHLGMFQPAVEKFTESHKLLHWHGEAELAATILEQLERINTQLATVTTDSDATGGGDA
jgi:tetratricopeptide (TPR) repeat protein